MNKMTDDTPQFHVAYTIGRGRGRTDELLEELADRLLSKGLKVSGTVQTNTECSDSTLCDMDVRVLPDGPVVRISQNLGKQSRGCRLDVAALEDAVSAVTQSLTPGAEGRRLFGRF